MSLKLMEEEKAGKGQVRRCFSTEEGKRSSRAGRQIATLITDNVSIHFKK